MSGGRILVTGGAGYIGSHTCKLLARQGYEPVTYDNLVTGNRDAVRWGPLVEGDIADGNRLCRAIVRYEPVALVHFAASAYVGESVTDPAKYYRNNVAGTLELLDCCRRSGLGRIIFSSSCATYGIPAALPIREDTPQRPINPYGRSKLMAEHMLGDYAAAYGLRYVALRYFNACGADPDGEIGEKHDPETHLIPRALMAAAGSVPHLSVFGDDYATADGTCVRDYIHVSDLAEAHFLAARHLLAGGDNLTVNLGAGRGISIREILQAVSRITARSVPVMMEPRRPGDPPALLADPDLARERLGFSARFSDIDTIVRTAAPFFGLEVRA
ncbi:UDP-L-arabinose 4-epimerase [Faunimonas pinastri]|uniref:UDP-glucose 4-epimerase n=1 Tax=Faunimonas pinastri TaxID=1855383 RepID=A0A1H9IDD9_9HYPH|nr:UDP-glucose 4-epimerase GalE [Faunimonas pinastri]SEQ72596.1 UDP-L-arabinose 4-epimerase [Faunimonas pinastri]